MLFTPNHSSGFPKRTEILLPLQHSLEVLLLSHAWVTGGNGRAAASVMLSGVSGHKSSTLNQKSYLKRWDFLL